MNTYLIGALALTATSAPGIANENEWLSMDSELESLRSFSTQADGPNLSGWIITSLRFAGDVAGGENFNGDGAPFSGDENDVGGFNLDSVRLNVEGSVSDYSYKISAELGESDGAGGPDPVGAGPPGLAPNRTALLLDAYVDWTVGESVNLRVGNFRQPFLKSGLVTRNRTLFTDRSILGNLFAGRQAGLQVSGDFEQVRWALAAQNGLDGIGDEFVITGRVEVDVLGNGVGDIEGAYGASDEAALTVGLAGFDEGGHSDGTAFALDAQFTTGAFYASGEIVSFDDGSNFGAPPNLFGAAYGLPGVPVVGLTDVSDTTPYAFTAAYMLGEDEYEIAARYEESDNVNDDSALTVGVNKYVHGHDIKWSLSYTMWDTNAALPADDADIIALSLAMGF